MGKSIEDVVVAAVQNSLSSEKIHAKIQEAADTAVLDSVVSIFQYSGEFRKKLTEEITKILPIPDATDLACFSDALKTVLQTKLSTAAEETAAASLKQILEDLLPAGQTIKLSELKAAYAAKILNDEGCDEDEDYEDFKWEIEDSAGCKTYWDLIISEDEFAGRYDAKSMVFRFRPATNSELFECWHCTHYKTENSVFKGPLYGFDAMVFRLATKVSLLEKDC